MPTKQHAKPATEQPAEPRLEAVIGKHLMHTLGQPADLQRVQVQRLWENHYRVNIIVGVTGVSTRVAHSYFVEVDSAGTIITATPTITKTY